MASLDEENDNVVHLNRKPPPTLEELDVMFAMLATIVDKLYERFETHEQKVEALLDGLDKRLKNLERRASDPDR